MRRARGDSALPKLGTALELDFCALGGGLTVERNKRRHPQLAVAASAFNTASCDLDGDDGQPFRLADAHHVRLGCELGQLFHAHAVECHLGD